MPGDPVRFQHYEVGRRGDGSLEELGRGAMGITYKAFDTNLRCFVALKVINANYLENETARQRFLREARAAAALRHPNVAAVFHLGEEGGDCFYAMEFVDGETVESLMKRSGPIPAPMALEITLQVARALGAAEKQGLVHRDIKPANLMIVHEDDTEFTVKVIDFGLAKNATGAGGEDAATVTMGGFLGTPHFASPEQLEERELDVRSDIYSLGVTLYYMLAGCAPFGGSIAQVMSQHLHREPPLERLGDQPKAVRDLLARMLAKDPAARPQSAAELRRDLEACLASVRSTTPVPPAGPVAEENFETQAMETLAETVVSPPPAPAAPPPLPPVPKGGGARNFGLAAVGLILIAGLVAGAMLGFRRGSKTAAVATPTPPPAVVAATPAPSATPLPTPDPFAEEFDSAKKLSNTDPAAGLAALLELEKENKDRTEVRSAVATLLSAVRESLPMMPPARMHVLKESVEAAANAGYAPAQVILGQQLRESDPTAALQWFLKAADSGDVEAMVQAGQMLAGGRGAPQDLPGAATWFQKAADAGDPRAMFLLAQCYYFSKGVTRDPRRAVDLLKEAASKNDFFAMNMLGDLYKKGVPGVLPVDFSKARDLFSAAKDGGFLDAQANLGVMYMNGGDGVEKDPATAVDLFRDGAEKGNPLCMYFYAGCLEDGLGGLKKDPDAARSWYVRAAAEGNQPAQAWCRKNQIDFTAHAP